MITKKVSMLQAVNRSSELFIYEILPKVWLVSLAQKLRFRARASEVIQISPSMNGMLFSEITRLAKVNDYEADILFYICI